MAVVEQARYCSSDLSKMVDVKRPVAVPFSGTRRAPNEVSVQWKTLIFDTEKWPLNNANANRILYK